MAYETDIFTGCDGLFYCMALWANNVTDGMFWSLVLFAFGIILFMATFNFGVSRAFLFGSVGVTFMSLLLIQMSLIPTWVLTLSLVVGAVGIIGGFVSGRR